MTERGVYLTSLAAPTPLVAYAGTGKLRVTIIVDGAEQVFDCERFTVASIYSVTVTTEAPEVPARTLRRVVAASTAAPWEHEATELMGLTIERKNAGMHVQLMEGTNILAEWWPSKGTTMMNGKRGPLCSTGEDLIAWLRSL